VAGDPERRVETERSKNGIPLGDGTWQCLTDTAARMGVAPPTESKPI